VETDNIVAMEAETDNIQTRGADLTIETRPMGASLEQRCETEALPGAVTGTAVTGAGSRDGNRTEAVEGIQAIVQPTRFTTPSNLQPSDKEMKERWARAYVHAMGIPYWRR